MLKLRPYPLISLLFLLTISPSLCASNYFPDQVEMERAVKALEDGFVNDGINNLKRAAEYGNKNAQLNLGLIYFGGMGVAPQPIEGCAWLALAASRGTPARIVEIKNQYCGELNESQLDAASRRRATLVDEYGDAEALKKRERWVRREKGSLTGSRVGSTSSTVRSYDPRGSTLNAPTTTAVQLHRNMEDYVQELRDVVGNVEMGETKVIE